MAFTLASFFDKNEIEAGCDEAGRGCLAGSVFAAAVILPTDFFHPLLNDSKKMTEKQRFLLRPLIEQLALSWAVGEVSAAEIDEINILNASFLAMHRAVARLGVLPTSLLIDGNRFRNATSIPHHCIVKGDGKFAAIAAASVLAKTYRDDYMDELATHFPHFGWQQNKGYPTAAHRRALAQHGASPHHRRTFRWEATAK